MPFTQQNIPAELFLSYKGVEIYHNYKDDDMDNGPMTYWYVFDENHNSIHAFDIREIPGFVDYVYPKDPVKDFSKEYAKHRNHLKKFFRTVIDSGRLQEFKKKHEQGEE